ncbi:MAG: flagellar basal-body MS-ring/collar protein FliF [Syntrophales bacterium]
MDPLSEFFLKLSAGFSSLTTAKKFSLLVASVVTLASIGLLVYWSGQVEYRVLFSNLSGEDAGNIVNKLQEKKVPYRLSSAGDAISVPAEKVAELRLEMATAGLPQGGGVGFEIFDNKTLGSTEFEQQLNYRRALQGELSRTINSLEEIQMSRVHLALPKDSLFLEKQKKATASVTVKLKQGKTLRPAQVEGIVHLVASSVEGISPEDVIIVDSRGNILSTAQSDSKLAKMSNAQADHQRSQEREIAARIQSLLENVVGKGKAVVRVSAEMDFRVTEKTEENYDPESPVIRSVKRQTEKTAPAGKAASDSPEKDKLDETINYEINRVVNKTVMPVGEIQKISVAVLIDGIYTKNDKGAEVYQPRPKKDIDTLEDLVKKSAGINATRGDQVVVTEMPFSRVEAEQESPVTTSWQEKIAAYVPIIKSVSGFIAIFAVLLFFVRPMIKGIMARDIPRSMGAAQQSALTTNAAVGLGGGVNVYSSPEGQDVKKFTDRDVASQLAGADSKKFAEILRTWLK